MCYFIWFNKHCNLIFTPSPAGSWANYLYVHQFQAPKPDQICQKVTRHHYSLKTQNVWRRSLIISEDINVLALNANKFILILSGHFHYCDNESDATKVPLFHRIQDRAFCFLLIVSSCESVCATAGSIAEQLSLLAWKASDKSEKLPG